MRSIIASGTPAGATRPDQASASTSMPASFNVGTSGNSAERPAVETASILIVPPVSCGVVGVAGVGRSPPGGERRRGAGADRAVGVFARTALDQVDQLRRVLHAEARID